MRNFKLFKKAALLLTVVALAAVLTIGVVAGIAWSEEGVDYGESYSRVQVSTSGKVSLKFYYSTLGTAETMVAEVNGTVRKTYNANELTPVSTTEGDLYCVTVPLAPSEMASTVTVYANGASGKGKTITYSVKDYANDVLADNTLSSWHDQMRTLLNWGAMAQAYFGNNDAAANDGLFANSSNPINGVSEISAAEGALSNGAAITADRYALSLERNDLALHFYVTYTGSEELTATVAREGLDATATTVSNEGNGEYKIRVSNINVNLFATPYTVTVKAGSDTCTFTASVNENLSKLVEGEHEDVVKNTAKAMYQFYQTATGNTGAATCQHTSIYWLAGDVAKCASCFGNHVCDANLALETVGNNYQVQCGLCNEVTYDYNIDKSAAVQYRDDNAVGSYTSWDVSNNGPGLSLKAQYEVGSPRFSRLKANPDKPTTTLQGGALLGGAKNDVNYLVLKFRVGANGLGQTTMNFYVNVYAETNALKIAVSEDDQWHTVVVDLKARVGDGTVYTGSYSGLLNFRPFGGSSTANVIAKDAYVDFAYAAGCATLDDVSKLVGEDTYEWSVSSTENEIRMTDTHKPYCDGNHALVSAGESGHYVAACDICETPAGQIVAHTLVDADGDGTGTCECGYSSCMTHTLALVADGNNYKVQCSVCSTVTYNYNIDKSAAATAAFRDDSAVSQYAGYSAYSTYGHFEEGSPRYARLKTNGATSAPQLGSNLFGGSSGNATINYLVLKFRVGENGLGQTYMSFYWGVYAETNSFRIAVEEDNEWHTVVVDLKARVGDGTVYNGTYNKVSYCRFFGGTAGQNIPDTAYVDFAYIAGCATLEDVSKLVGEDTYEWSVSNTENEKRDSDTHLPYCDGNHALVSDGANGHYEAACTICGTAAGATVAHQYVETDSARVCECGHSICKTCTYSLVADGNNYLVKCSVCSTVTYNYNIDKSAAATAAFRDDSAVSQYAGYSAYSTYGHFEEGSPRYARLKTNGATSAPQLGSNLFGGSSGDATINYLVLKFRVGENGLGQTYMSFYWGAYAETNSFRIAVEEDNEWHTVVVDLKARVGDGTVYNGTYNKVSYCRFFGGTAGQNIPDTAYVDFAYIAGCATLEDVSKLVGEDTYEWSVSNTENEKRDSATHESVAAN